MGLVVIMTISCLTGCGNENNRSLKISQGITANFVDVYWYAIGDNDPYYCILMSAKNNSKQQFEFDFDDKFTLVSNGKEVPGICGYDTLSSSSDVYPDETYDFVVVLKPENTSLDKIGFKYENTSIELATESIDKIEYQEIVADNGVSFETDTYSISISKNDCKIIPEFYTNTDGKIMYDSDSEISIEVVITNNTSEHIIVPLINPSFDLTGRKVFKEETIDKSIYDYYIASGFTKSFAQSQATFTSYSVSNMNFTESYNCISNLNNVEIYDNNSKLIKEETVFGGLRGVPVEPNSTVIVRFSDALANNGDYSDNFYLDNNLVFSNFSLLYEY